jgi:signal peptidase I
MEPTLPLGTVVFARTENLTPKVGDIVILHPPEGAAREQCGPTPDKTIAFGGAVCDQTNPRPESSLDFIKRIVAGPGDVLYVKEGHVYVDGKRERDPYIRACGGVQECNFPTPITIPAGSWFMMGDNRGESDDSRFWGPVPTSWIVGEVQWCSTIDHPCEESGQ